MFIIIWTLLVQLSIFSIRCPISDFVTQRTIESPSKLEETFRVVIGRKQRHSCSVIKQEACNIIPDHLLTETINPEIAVEVGFSQTYENLLLDMQQWLLERG